MFKSTRLAVITGLVFMVSCKHKPALEQEKTRNWNSLFIDSSFSLLYSQRDTAAALRHFDASMLEYGHPDVYVKASRFAIKANYHYFFTGDDLETARMIDSALGFYKRPGLQNRYPRHYEGLLLFGGHIAYRLSQYDKANNYYFKAKKIAETHLSPCDRAAFNYNMAMVLYRQENYDQSAKYFREAFLLQQSCSPQTAAIVLQQQEILSNTGLCFVQLKNHDSAGIYFDRALALAERHRELLGAVTMEKIRGVIYGNKSQISLAKGQLHEAEALALRSISLNDREGFEVENAKGVKLQLAEVYGRKRDFVSMYKLLKELNGVLDAGGPRMQMDWNRLMALYHEGNMRSDSALYYFRRYASLGDSVSGVQKVLAAADVDRQLQEKEQELQIAVLTKEQQLTLTYLFLTIIVSVMAMVIIYLVYQHYKRSRKNLAMMQQLNEEIKKQKAAREAEAQQRHKMITEAVIKAQERERSMIGLELHDNVNQVLTTVKLHNEMVLEGIGEAKVILPRTMQYLQDCINEIRSLSKRLSAPTLGKISLEESVNDLIESINVTNKVKITRQFSGLDNRCIRQDVHLSLYRILQEQLNNVLKHSGASEVFVRLEQDDARLKLYIRDNGKGFVVHSGRDGIGLMNMRIRAENLNGHFNLRSQPGKGCEVVVELPNG